MIKKENIFITWHYTTHGIAYLKHILSAFYKYGLKEVYEKREFSQLEMNKAFGDINNSKQGYAFDKIYYLTSEQKAFDKLSMRRFYLNNILENDQEIEKDLKLNEIWTEIVKIRKDNYIKRKEYRLQDEIYFVKDKYPEHYNKWERTLWRDMHHYPIKDQVMWFGKYSNAKNVYKSGERFINKQLEIKNLRDVLQISKKVIPFIDNIKKEHPHANFVINSSLGSNETQVVWQVLSELNVLPPNTSLIQTYDNKQHRDKKFKPFIITKVPNKIVTEISKQLPLYSEEAKSESRKLAELKMANYINSGFTVLLLGERGIGKTKLAEKAKKSNSEIININCASFTNNLIAESILFGYKKGAFTDAHKDRDGAFKEANNGILFMDEIHHLDKVIQAKLMKALQTDENNNYTITPFGGGKTDEIKLNITIIMASNISINVLRKKLLPDFYDRITQLVIELPPLRNSKEDIINQFEKIWKQMKFEDQFPYKEKVSKDKKLLNWIPELDLFGNYRDLQKIAIYYKTFLSFKDDIKNLLKDKSAFEFTKSEFGKYISTNEEIFSQPFATDKKAEQIIDNFKGRLAEWAIKEYKGAPNAAAHFKELGGKTTVSTLYIWKKLAST